MSHHKYANLVEKAWDKANHCQCNQEDCTPNNHRLCGICGQTIMYGSYASEVSQIHSHYRWDVDHIVPRNKGGTDKISNIQATHVKCNKKKANSVHKK